MRANFDRDAYYPVRSYRVGNKYIAACNGVERVASTCDGHTVDKDLLKRAEKITDAIFANRSGGSHFVNGEGLPCRGYIVSYAGYETCFNPIDGRYGEVYADVVDKLEAVGSIDSAGRPCCIGWWNTAYSNGFTYIDVSRVIFDRDEALGLAELANQVAIFDIVNKRDIQIRYA